MDMQCLWKCGAALAALLAAAFAQPARADQVRLHAEMAQPYALVGSDGKAYLRVTLKGFKPVAETKRAPANVAIVLDKSGSMTGAKIENAKTAAIKALSMLGPNDIVSVVTYDDNVHVLVPSTKLTERDYIVSCIAQIQPGGSTALFAGVSKGAAEVRKFLDKGRVNRVILLSDGLANVGPSTPGDLAELGTSLSREGIAVTTIGLGLDFNEDLMTKLAQSSDGNHMFAERAEDLERMFAREFGDVLSVVAQDVEVVIECADGIRPVRVLGRDAEIVGRRVVTAMNQIYGDQEKYVFLEVELPRAAAKNGAQLEVANVQAKFNDTLTQRTEVQQARATVAFTDSQTVVDEKTNALVMASVVEQVAVERNKHALELRDAGRIDEAKKELTDNAFFLNDNALRLNNEALKDYADSNEAASKQVEDDAEWNRLRKGMREEQHNKATQQQNVVKP